MANNSSSLIKLTPNLFGLPYQFPDAVDPRVKKISGTFGKNYAERILTEAPVCTIIPGVPSYLPGKSKSQKINTSLRLLQENGDFDSILSSYKNGALEDRNLRLYDFKASYADYMKYVNILCRTGAIFLGLQNTKITANGYTSNLAGFDWAKYRWISTKETSIVGKLSGIADVARSTFFKGTSGSSSMNASLTNYNFIQFYIDSEIDASESMGNTSTSSMIKSALDQGSQTMKQIGFLTDSAGLSDQTAFLEGSAEALTSGLSSIVGGAGTVGSVVSRILDLGSDVLTGANVVIPDIYQSSEYSKSYSITIHLKTPYGTPLGYYLNEFVPLMHIIALVLPRQKSANSYDSPFIVKAYVDGVFSCNLGLVTGCSIRRAGSSYSVDGLPSEIDVTLDITDLYSNLFMSPSTSPIKFINNSSLVEYLAVNTGLSLISPNIDKKAQMMLSTSTQAISDVPSNIGAIANEKVSSWLNGLLSLY